MTNFENKNTFFLVTGGAGFIGSNLCERLIDEGYQVRCLDNLSTGTLQNIQPLMANANFEFIQGSIVDYEVCLKATDGVDIVLHQAALGSVPRSIKFPLIYEETNIKGMLNMLQASVENKIKKFVYASSSSVYGDSQELPKKEGGEGNLLSPYALTKQVNEMYAKLYTSVYQLPTVGLRYFNVFGRRQNPQGQYAAVIPKFIEQLKQKQAPTINGDGLQSRDFTYIDNVVDANLLAASSSAKTNGKAYNIASNGQVTLNELYDLLQKKLTREDVAANYGPDRAGDIKHSYADVSSAKEDFGYVPKISFEQGLDRAVEWFNQ